jgi:hypothetical protein
MTVERVLRGIAGFFVILSVLLAHYHSPYWLLFTAFVGLNLLQSSARVVPDDDDSEETGLRACAVRQPAGARPDILPPARVGLEVTADM